MAWLLYFVYWSQQNVRHMERVFESISILSSYPMRWSFAGEALHRIMSRLCKKSINFFAFILMKVSAPMWKMRYWILIEWYKTAFIYDRKGIRKQYVVWGILEALLDIHSNYEMRKCVYLSVNSVRGLQVEKEEFFFGWWTRFTLGGRGQRWYNFLKQNLFLCWFISLSLSGINRIKALTV